MKEDNCPICGSKFSRQIEYINLLKHSLFENRFISVCKTCGFSKLNSKISTNEILYYYKNVYRSKNSLLHIDFKNLSLPNNIIDYRASSQLKLGLQFISKKDNYSFLDIGPGNGSSFVYAKKLFGDNTRLYAIELNDDAKAYYTKTFNGINIYNDIADIQNKLDILLMSHSLEHFAIDDMEILFINIYKALTDDGIVIIEIPHDDFRDTTFLDKRLNDAPHLSFFSLESFRMFLKCTNFELCFLDTVGALKDDLYTKNIIRKGRQSFFKMLLKNSIKSLRLYDFLIKFRTGKYLYKNENFIYGGNRTALRCVLKKNKTSNISSDK